MSDERPTTGRVPGRWPALDGLRAISVAAVFGFHFDTGVVKGGWLGVDVFFVLSGLLITTLLLGEWDRHRRIAVKAFYARRALRLFPALAVNAVACLIWVSIPGPDDVLRHSTLFGLPFVLIYSVNWIRAFDPHGPGAGLFIQTWSLAVEEQFYLVWPAVAIVLSRRGWRRERIGVVLLGLAVADAAYRELLAHLGAEVYRLYNATDTRCDGLLVGAGLAFLLASDLRSRPWFARLERRLLAPITVAALAGLGVLFAAVPDVTVRQIVLGVPLANLCAAIVVWSLVTRPLRPLRVLLESRPFQWVGKRSYGLYLWQWPILLCSYFYLTHSTGGRLLREALQIGLTIAFAAASYRFVELPFLRRKRRFQRSEAIPAELSGLTEPGPG